MYTKKDGVLLKRKIDKLRKKIKARVKENENGKEKQAKENGMSNTHKNK